MNNIFNNLELNENNCNILFKFISKNNSVLKMEEFMSFFLTLIPNIDFEKQVLASVFSLLDYDQKGYITEIEFKKIMQEFINFLKSENTNQYFTDVNVR